MGVGISYEAKGVVGFYRQVRTKNGFIFANYVGMYNRDVGAGPSNECTAHVLLCQTEEL